MPRVMDVQKALRRPPAGVGGLTGCRENTMSLAHGGVPFHEAHPEDTTRSRTMIEHPRKAHDALWFKPDANPIKTRASGAAGRPRGNQRNEMPTLWHGKNQWIDIHCNDNTRSWATDLHLSNSAEDDYFHSRSSVTKVPDIPAGQTSRPAAQQTFGLVAHGGHPAMTRSCMGQSQISPRGSVSPRGIVSPRGRTSPQNGPPRARDARASMMMNNAWWNDGK